MINKKHVTHTAIELAQRYKITSSDDVTLNHVQIISKPVIVQELATDYAFVQVRDADMEFASAYAVNFMHIPTSILSIRNDQPTMPKQMDKIYAIVDNTFTKPGPDQIVRAYLTDPGHQMYPNIENSGLRGETWHDMRKLLRNIARENQENNR